MTTQFRGAPIFDADQHMYETPESLTQLPAREVLARRAIRPVRPADPDRDQQQGQRLHPQPDVRAGRRARGAREVLRRREHRRTDAARDAGPGHRGARRDPQPRRPRRRTRPPGRRRGAELPDAGQPGRALQRRRSGADAGDHPRAQPVDARALDVQLRGPGVLDADHQPLRGRRRPARTGVPARPRRQGRIDQTRPGQRYPRLALTRTAGVRPVLARRRGRRACRSCCTPAIPRSTTTSPSGSRRTPRTSWRRALSAGWCWATARSPT